MQEHKCNRLKIINIIAICIYILTYILAFFNVENSLVIADFDDDYRYVTHWDTYTWSLIWVGIAFTIELRLFKLLRKMTDVNASRQYRLISYLQPIFICMGLYSAIRCFIRYGTVYADDVTIKFLSVYLAAFMLTQIFLCIYRFVSYRKSYQNISEEEITVNEFYSYTQTRKNAIKVMEIAFGLSMVGYYFWSIMMGVLYPRGIPVILVFSLFVLVFPFWMLIHNVLSYMIKTRRYIHAIAVVIMHVVAYNGTYRHLLDRFYDDSVYPWPNLIVELINIVAGIIAVSLIVYLYRRAVTNEEISEDVKRNNGIKCTKKYVILAICTLLCIPIGIRGEDKRFTYSTIWYSVNYSDMNTNSNSYIADDKVISVDVKLLGITVYNHTEMMNVAE